VIRFRLELTKSTGISAGLVVGRWSLVVGRWCSGGGGGGGGGIETVGESLVSQEKVICFRSIDQDHLQQP
jgi:hypothetical protein